MSEAAAEPVAAGLCPNCGAPARGRYCAECGQRQDRRLASLRRMAAEAAEDQFSLGAELPRTLHALFLHPGLLTSDYLAGRVARYVAPLRLYLISSLVFFVLLSWTTTDFRAAVEDVAEDRSEELAEERSSGAGSVAADEAPGGRRISMDVDTLAPGPLLPARRWVQRRIDHLNTMDATELQERFFAAFQANVPKAVFLLLPLYALLLKIVYVRRRRLYAEHFIFALHTHAFTFLVFTLTLFVPELLDQLIVVVWIPLYLWLAMRRVYPQSVPRTLAKYLLLGFGYSLLLGLVLTATILLTALTV